MSTRTIKVIQPILADNERAAEENRRAFEAHGVLAVNVIASPGAGKTSLIVRTLRALAGKARVGVIEGDVAGQIDTEKVLQCGAQDAVQINTGGNCHLEAGMVRQALGRLQLEHLDLVFIENVGNLICPTHWALGEHLTMCVASAAEGHDKPVKYPEIFARSKAVVLNKIDLIELVEFDLVMFRTALRSLNPEAPLFELSCRTGQGVQAWVDWLLRQGQANRYQAKT